MSNNKDHANNANLETTEFSLVHLKKKGEESNTVLLI